MTENIIKGKERILCIESATGLCSVALCSREGIIALRESGDEKAHSRLLAPFVDEILRESGSGVSGLSAIAVSKGPGSYTGLRIGVSMAKGLAYGASLPLIAVDTLLALYHRLVGLHPHFAEADDNTLFCPMLDARRMEVYHSLIDSSGNTVKAARAAIVDSDYLDKMTGERDMVFFGDGSAKCRQLTDKPGARFIDGIQPSAGAMRIPAFRAFDEGKYEDLAYFEPFYLKEFQATSPRKMMP